MQKHKKSHNSASAVFMVRPTSFGFDEQTAESNAFQQRLGASVADITHRALAEFDTLVATLRGRGIEVVVFEDDAKPAKPNAVFPNNWLSTWPDGRLYLYPMATESRRIERSPAAIELLAQHFEVCEVIDISGAEQRGTYLESTGAIVFDHPNKLAYGCLSVRCDEELFTSHVKSLGYTPIAFRAHDAAGMPIYHTNVLMGVQTNTAVICAEAITDVAERQRILASLAQTGRQVVEISLNQMAQFCGNVLEVAGKRGERFLALSRSAYDAFTPEQRTVLANCKTLLPVALPTIEAVGGGSARCMLAEIFLPPKESA